MKRICSVTGCDKPYQAKGFCSPHYRQERAKQPCGVEGCDRPFYQAGFCAGHYARKLAHGDPLAGKAFDGEGLRWLKSTVKQCLTDEVAECVEQNFHDSVSGYATVIHKGQRLRMHVVALLLAGRDAPKAGEVTRHLCNNGRCVNPRHLLVGTQAENVHDSISAGIWSNLTYHGERVNTAKLTEDDVRFIRSSREPSAILARRFLVSTQTIACVRTGKTWKHLL